jgi:hypothetical protein
VPPRPLHTHTHCSSNMYTRTNNTHTSCASLSSTGTMQYRSSRPRGVICPAATLLPLLVVLVSRVSCWCFGDTAAPAASVTVTATLTGLRSPARARASTASCSDGGRWGEAGCYRCYMCYRYYTCSGEGGCRGVTHPFSDIPAHNMHMHTLHYISTPTVCVALNSPVRRWRGSLRSSASSWGLNPMSSSRSASSST